VEALHLKTIDETTQWHENILPGCDFMDIYDNFEVDLMSCEVIQLSHAVFHYLFGDVVLFLIECVVQVKILVPIADAAVSILDKSNGSVLLSRCLLLDEPKVKQLEVTFSGQHMLFILTLLTEGDWYIAGFSFFPRIVRISLKNW
jgi:hypothetical protein